MKIKALPVVISLLAIPFAAYAAAPATAYLQFESSLVDQVNLTYPLSYAENLFVIETSCLGKWPCTYTRLESAPFINKGTYNIIVQQPFAWHACMVTFQLPFTARDGKLETNAITLTGKWEKPDVIAPEIMAHIRKLKIGADKIKSKQPDDTCPTSIMTLTVTPPDKNFEGYKLSLVESK